MSVHDDPSDQSATAFGPGAFDGSGFTAGGLTHPIGAPGDDDGGSRQRAPDRWHAGLDIGLLVLRLALGVTMIAHGLRKFGLFDGPGIGGFAEVLVMSGYTGPTTLLSWITALTEVGGGLLLVLGLFTPLGAAAVLGVTANVVFVKFSGGFFLGQGAGFEYELLLAVVAFALLFTGAGRVALDKNTPWRRRPLPFGSVALMLAAGATVLTLLLFR